MRHRKFYRTGLQASLLLLLLFFYRLPLHAQSDTTPLIIGYYGLPDTPAVQAMQLAVEEINAEGGFEGADGGKYTFELRVTQNPNDLVEAVSVLASPELRFPGRTVAWQMPVFLLSPTEGLALQNIQATVFRGMTDQQVQNDALAEYLVNELAVTEITVIGSDIFIESLNRTASPPQIQHYRKDALTPEQLRQIPQAIYYAGTDSAPFIQMLIAADWRGILINDQPIDPIEGIRSVNVASWLPTLTDDLSRAFTSAYSTTYRAEPDAFAVAAYDLTWAVRLLITRIGADAELLRDSLRLTDTILTTQGEMRPSEFGGRDMFRSVVVYELQADGIRQVLSRAGF